MDLLLPLFCLYQKCVRVMEKAETSLRMLTGFQLPQFGHNSYMVTMVLFVLIFKLFLWHSLFFVCYRINPSGTTCNQNAYTTHTQPKGCVNGVNRRLLFVLPLFGHSLFFRRPHWVLYTKSNRGRPRCGFFPDPFCYNLLRVLGLNA